MRSWTLDLLKCVRPVDQGQRCLGPLSVAQEPPPQIQGEEIREGALRCAACGVTYPVVAGVAVVLDNAYRYFRWFYPFAKGFLEEVGGMSRPFQVWLHQRMLADLERKSDKLFPRPVTYNDHTAHPLHKWLATYLLTHFLDPVGSGEPLVDALLSACHHRGPLNTLHDMVARHARDPSVGVDLGCSVGGLSVRLSGLCGRVVGIDISFEKILTARRVVLGEPARPSPLRLYHEGISYETVPLPPVSARNVDFIVASAHALPLEGTSVDVVTSCNLIDIVSEPLEVLKETVRVLKGGGLLAMSTPYLDHTDAVVRYLEGGRGDPRKTVLENLPGFTVLEEAEKVPWILRASDRHYDLYLDHCFLARRDGGAPSPTPTPATTPGPERIS